MPQVDSKNFLVGGLRPLNIAGNRWHVLDQGYSDSQGEKNLLPPHTKGIVIYDKGVFQIQVKVFSLFQDKGFLEPR